MTHDQLAAVPRGVYPAHDRRDHRLLTDAQATACDSDRCVSLGEPAGAEWLYRSAARDARQSGWSAPRKRAVADPGSGARDSTGGKGAQVPIEPTNYYDDDRRHEPCSDT